jgi:hypothetical protein
MIPTKPEVHVFGIRRRLDLQDAVRLERIHHHLKDIINNPGSLTQMVILFNLMDGLNENHGRFYEEPYINPRFNITLQRINAKFDRLERLLRE